MYFMCCDDDAITVITTDEMTIGEFSGFQSETDLETSDLTV